MTPKLFKASEVCEATGLQPYVLRSWEKEFPGIGVQKSVDSPRLYRQADLEQVLRIKQLVFGEGLTLAGARRRLEESAPKAPAETRDAEIAEVLDTLGADARKRVALVRGGLQSILEVLSTQPGATALAPMRAVTGGASGSSRSAAPKSRSRGGSAASRKAPARLSSRPPAKGRAAARKASKSKRRRAGA